MLSAGQVLRDRYQLQQKLGQNAGRQTWLATDMQASPPADVVVKLLAFNPQMQWDDLKLFQREAQVLKNLNHPRIPKYLDYFSVDGVGASLEASSADNNSDQSNATGLPWFGLVQDYIPGDSLKQLLEQGKPFSENQVRQFAEDLLKILIDLHELSPPVLHRDIKPSNLILGENNQIYLVDFGAVQDKAKAEGATFTVVGTSGYAPPEQLWGKAVPASDLYALGATLIHLLTGIPPAELPQQQMRIKFQDKVRINPNFANWINQLIQPAPEKRLSTARQALSSLQSCFISHPSEISAPESISPLSDTDGGYGCGCFALLGLIGLGGLISLFLSNAAHQAKQSEAKQYVGAMNRAQQAYFLDKNAFTDNVKNLELGIISETKNYSYSSHTTPLSSINYGVSRKSNLKSYVGGVFWGSVERTRGSTFTILCKAKSLGTNRPPAPIVQEGVIQCAPNTVKINGGSFIGNDWNLAERAANYASAGEYNQALDTAETITDEWFKAKALEIIATNLTVTGKTEQAVQIAETITDEWLKAKVLAVIALELAAASEYDPALPIIERVQAIALNLTDAGEYTQALTVTRTIPHDSIRSNTIAAIAPYLTTATEYEQAIQVANTITNYEQKAKALDAMVRRLVAIGEQKRAVQITETIQLYYGGKDKAMTAIERYKPSP